MSSASQVSRNVKKYEKPALKVYGNIEGLTATVGNSLAAADSGMAASSKTH